MFISLESEAKRAKNFLLKKTAAKKSYSQKRLAWLRSCSTQKVGNASSITSTKWYHIIKSHPYIQQDIKVGVKRENKQTSIKQDQLR